MGVGFIRDKLEIKFLILYIAARVSEPLPLEGMQELTMCDDGIDYFAFSECLADLVKTEHLRLTDDGCYAITPKGLRNSEICESSLPYSVRIRTDKNVAAYNKKLLRRSAGACARHPAGKRDVHGGAVLPRRRGRADAAAGDGRDGGDGQRSGRAVREEPGADLYPADVGALRRIKRNNKGAPPAAAVFVAAGGFGFV